MTTAERIRRQIDQLPESFQKKALDFIESLTKKANRENSREEDLDWFDLSVSAALSDFKDEDDPIYNESDLKEKWN